MAASPAGTPARGSLLRRTSSVGMKGATPKTTARRVSMQSVGGARLPARRASRMQMMGKDESLATANSIVEKKRRQEEEREADRIRKKMERDQERERRRLLVEQTQQKKQLAKQDAEGASGPSVDQVVGGV